MNSWTVSYGQPWLCFWSVSDRLFWTACVNWLSSSVYHLPPPNVLIGWTSQQPKVIHCDEQRHGCPHRSNLSRNHHKKPLIPVHKSEVPIRKKIYVCPPNPSDPLPAFDFLNYLVFHSFYNNSSNYPHVAKKPIIQFSKPVPPTICPPVLLPRWQNSPSASGILHILSSPLPLSSFSPPLPKIWDKNDENIYSPNFGWKRIIWGSIPFQISYFKPARHLPPKFPRHTVSFSYRWAYLINTQTHTVRALVRT